MKTIFAAMQRGLSSSLLIIVLVLSITSAARAQGGSGPTDGGPMSASAVTSNPADSGQTPEKIVPASSSSVPGGPGFVAISGLDFRPYEPSVNYSFTGGALYNRETSAKHYLATFNIPNGATINKMVAYYLDADSATNLSITLARFPFSASSGHSMATFSSSGSLLAFVYGETTTIYDSVVDLSAYSYGIDVYLPPGNSIGLNAVRIDYGYPNSLPVIVNTTP